MRLQTQLKWTLNYKEGSYEKVLKFDQELHSTDIRVIQVNPCNIGAYPNEKWAHVRMIKLPLLLVESAK